MKKFMKLVLKISAAVFGFIMVANLLLEIDSKMQSEVAYNTLRHLNEYHKKCSKYPTTAEGLEVLKKGSSCYSPGKTNKKLVTENGYGYELVYESDGSKLILTSKSLFRDRVFTEEILAP